MRFALILFLSAANLQAAFTYYSPITVDHTKVPSAQTNFAVLVSKTDTRFKTTGNGGHVQNSSGFDIRPYSDSGLTSSLTYELERYNASTGEVVMWVKIASLSSSSDTIIYLAYGDSGLSSNGSSNATWDSNFLAVYHMADNAANTTIKDSTSNANNGVNVANTSTKTTTGEVNGGLTYNGSTDASSAAINLSSTNLVTLSFWVNWTTNANDDHLAFEFTTNYNSTNGILVDWDASGGNFQFGQHDTTGTTYWTDSFTRPSAGSWHKVDLVMQRSTVGNAAFNKGYVDGTSQTLTAATHTQAGAVGNFDNSTLYFMSRATTSLFAAGSADEIRVSNVERSADWITTSFNNQSAPGTFETLGTEVSLGAPSTSRGFLLFFP